MNAVAGTAIAGGAGDSELVKAARAGDDCAFEELYRRYRPRVARMVGSMLRDEGRAEDATQEAFLSALRRMRETDAEIRFRPWISEIARNAAIDVHRRRSRAEEVSLDASGGLAPADRLRLSRPGDLDRALVDRERMQTLRGALDELSETHHRVIVLRELEGRSYREIGESTGLSQAAVESTLFRARRKLEHEYDQIDSGRRCTATSEAIERLALGGDAERDRRRLARHARRCSSCRRYARARGVEPLAPSRLGRVAALLPLPALLRRRLETLAASDPSNITAVAPAADRVADLGARAATAVAALAVALGGGSMIDAPASGTRAGVPASADALPASVRRASEQTPRRSAGPAGVAADAPAPGGRAAQRRGAARKVSRARRPKGSPAAGTPASGPAPASEPDRPQNAPAFALPRISDGAEGVTGAGPSTPSEPPALPSTGVPASPSVPPVAPDDAAVTGRLGVQAPNATLP